MNVSYYHAFVPINPQDDDRQHDSINMKRQYLDNFDDVPDFIMIPHKKPRTSPSSWEQEQTHSKIGGMEKTSLENILTGFYGVDDNTTHFNNRSKNSQSDSLTYPMIHMDFITPTTPTTSSSSATTLVTNHSTNHPTNHPIDTTTTIDWVELQLEFLRTLKKLNKSIQRSDLSRLFVRKTSLGRNDYNTTATSANNNTTNMYHHDTTNTTGTTTTTSYHSLYDRYYMTPQWTMTEQQPTYLTQIVQSDCLYRTVF